MPECPKYLTELPIKNLKSAINNVICEKKPGYFKETDNDAVMEKVDRQGNIVGFSVLNISELKKQQPLSVSLKSVAA